MEGRKERGSLREKGGRGRHGRENRKNRPCPLFSFSGGIYVYEIYICMIRSRLPDNLDYECLDLHLGLSITPGGETVRNHAGDPKVLSALLNVTYCLPSSFFLSSPFLSSVDGKHNREGDFPSPSTLSGPLSSTSADPSIYSEMEIHKFSVLLRSPVCPFSERERGGKIFNPFFLLFPVGE
jgi:hypothetical protein